MQPQQQWVPPGTVEPPRRSGRGFIIAGGITLGLAILGVSVAVLIFGGSFDPNSLTRDVALTGAAESDLPGQLGFKVLEDISSDEDTMSVGVVLDPDTGALRNSASCRILTVDGEEVPTRGGGDPYTFLDPDMDAAAIPFLVAEDLQPGEYSAVCELSGEPSDANATTFSVGRVASPGDLIGMFTPVLGIFAAIAIGGVVGLVGLILLVVGLVINSRSHRGPPAPPYQQNSPPGPYGSQWR